jgi:hypothetical protein
MHSSLQLQHHYARVPTIHPLYTSPLCTCNGFRTHSLLCIYSCGLISLHFRCASPLPLLRVLLHCTCSSPALLAALHLLISCASCCTAPAHLLRFLLHCTCSSPAFLLRPLQHPNGDDGPWNHTRLHIPPSRLKRRRGSHATWVRP